MFKTYQFSILLPLLGLLIKFVNCLDQAQNSNSKVILVPLIRYDTEKRQVLSYGGSSLNNIDGLNEAIENAVNLILEYEQDMDKKQGKQQNMQQGMQQMMQQDMPKNMQQDMKKMMQQDMQQDMRQMMQQDMPQNMQQDMQQDMPKNMQQDMKKMMPQSMQQGMRQMMQQDMPKNMQQDMQEYMQQQPKEMMNYNNNQISSSKDQYKEQDNNQQNPNYYQTDNQKYNQEMFIQIPSSKPLYKQNEQDNYKENNQYNNQNNQNPMIKANYLSINSYNYDNRQKLERNQKYVKKLMCKTRNHRKEMMRQYPSSSNNYSNFQFKSTYNQFNRPRIYRPSPYPRANNVIKYPIYVTDPTPHYATDYDTQLINRLYKYRNIFI